MPEGMKGGERAGKDERPEGIRRLFFAARQPLLEFVQRFGDRKHELEELRRMHGIVAEQNRHNELRAQAWRLALDRGTSEKRFIQKILDTVGPAMDLSRAVFLRVCPETGDATAEQQWCAEGVGTPKGVKIPAEMCTLYRNRKYIELPQDLMPGTTDLTRLMEKSQTKSCLLIPYGDPEELRGFIALTDRKERLWSDAEKGTLEEMVRIISTRAEHARLERRICKIQSMELIGKLAAGMAHDLNNMLAGVSGYAELIKTRHASGVPELGRKADAIINASKRAADLAEKVLAFSRQGKYDVKVINAHESVDDAVALLEKTVEKRIAIVKKLDAKQPFINAYGVQICNALVNLGIRAVEDMPEGGILTYETDVVELGRSFSRAKPYKVAPGKYLRISVRDTGRGMDNDAVTTLFEPFSGTSHGAASGLGMASVYGIVKNHEGYIEARSGEGKGTVVDVYLPIAAAPVAQRMAGKVVRGHGGILVVDDESELRKLLKAMLDGIGYEVHVCEDGAKALEFYRHHGKEIGLVLLDMMMPEMSGKACFAELRKINPDVRVLIMSGYAQGEDTNRMLEAGAAGFLQKPFEFGAMSAEIRKHIGEA